MMDKLPKILAIVGPTASGKTDMAIALAKKFNGEIISADSRQIYKRMNIGTAKPKGEWRSHPSCVPPQVPTASRDPRFSGIGTGGKTETAYFVEGVPHHMMDAIEPDEEYSLAQFKEAATEHVNNILGRGKLPIIAGGTGLYVWALVDNLDMPRVPPSAKLRKELEEKSPAALAELLKKIDPESAEKIDLKNPRRVLRALEVFILSGRSFISQRLKSAPLFDALQIGMEIPREELYARISRRVDRQMEDGLAQEVKNLAERYGWKTQSMSGIGYKQMGYFLRGEMNLDEAVEIFKKDTCHYARRQMTWFRRDKRIKWVGSLEEAKDSVEKFLA